MPSGLTSDIYENKNLSLRNFALKCATQFGFAYCFTQDGEKELPFDKVPKATVSSYYYKRIETAKHDFDYWTGVSKNPEELQRLYQEDVDKHRGFGPSINENKRDIKSRYEDMLKKVNEWPVDGDLECVKKLMITQLQECIDYDCEEYAYEDYVPAPIDEWIADKIKFAQEDIVKSEESLKKEKERVAKVNNMIKRLYENIDNYEPIEESIKLSHGK